MPRSPHWTKKMKPMTDILRQNVLVTGVKSRSASLISCEICLIIWPYKIKMEPATMVSPRLLAQLSKNDSLHQRQTKYVIRTATSRNKTLTILYFSRLCLVDSIPSTFRTSCSVERYSRVNMRRLSHWKTNWPAYSMLLITFSFLLKVASMSDLASIMSYIEFEKFI